MESYKLQFGRVHSFHRAAEELKKFANLDNPMVQQIFDNLPQVETQELKSPIRISRFLDELKQKIASVSPDDPSLTIENNVIIFGDHSKLEELDALKNSSSAVQDSHCGLPLHLDVGVSGVIDTGAES